MRLTILSTVLALGILAPSADAKGTVSPAKAFILSLVLPGLGQYYVDDQFGSATFAGLELAGWTAWASMTSLSSSYRDDYLARAAGVAGANVKGQPDRYFADMAFFDSRADHNGWAMISGEDPIELYTAEDDWHWPGDTDRLAYRKARNTSNEWKRNAEWTLTAIVLNHLASAVHAGKMAGKKSSDSEGTLSFAPLYSGGVLAYRWRF